MSAFESSGRTEKIPLKCSNIEISGIRCELEQKYKLATLVIGKFYQLKNDIEYVITPHLELEGDVRFIKNRSNHTIKINANDLGNVTASVLYEKLNTSKPVLAEQVADGEYVIVIPSSVVENVQNTFLKEGRLLIHIKFRESENVLKRTHACSGKREKCSEERLAEDLKSVSIYPHDTDIIFKAEKQNIRVPRGLLACRSDLLKEYPDTDEIDLNTYYETVSYAVRYLYTGMLPPLEEMEGQDICRFMEVATSLKIRSLESKCLSLINQSIIQGDVETSGIDKEECVTS